MYEKEFGKQQQKNDDEFIHSFQTSCDLYLKAGVIWDTYDYFG